MRRFITICLVAGLLCVLTAFGSSMLIDPYNVFHVDNIRDNGIEPNKNYIKVSYLLGNPEKFDTLIVGSSHVGALHVELIEDEKCYNMTCPESLPCEELENLKSLLRGGYKPRKIYLGVDSWSYRGNPELHKIDKRTVPYEMLQNKCELMKNYIDPHNALFSLVTSLRHNKTPNFQSIFYDYGWMIDYDMPSSYNWNEVDKYESGVTNRLEDTINEIKEYVDLCEQEGIELVMFINPYCAEEFVKDIEHDYMVFLKELIQIHSYYNFAGINSYTIDHTNFIDPSHYNAYLGDVIIRVITKEDYDDNDNENNKAWGMYVTPDNFETFRIKLMLDS